MSLIKGIESGKEKRKQHPNYKLFDPSCRNHGRCPHCENGRKHNTRKKLMAIEEQEKYSSGFSIGFYICVECKKSSDVCILENLLDVNGKCLECSNKNSR